MTPNSQSPAVGRNTQIISLRNTPSLTYAVDFESGRVRGRTDGIEAMRQAIFKILRTERFSYLIYSWNYGTEYTAVIGRSYDVLLCELERIIKEALLADDRINDVTNLTVRRIDRRSAAVSFTAQTMFGDVPLERVVDFDL